MIDLIIIIMAGIVLLFLLSCCFMVARLLDEEISMYGYEGKENWEREQLPDKLSRSSTDGSDGLGRRKVICAVQHNLFIEADSEKLKPMTSRQFVGKWKGAKFQ